jgi:hypothetical protein
LTVLKICQKKKISTEFFEKKFRAGIWFFWSQTSRFWPKINLELKNLAKVGAAHLCCYPLPKMVMVLRKFVYIIKRDFFLARFEFFTTSNILGKLLVGA